MRKNAVYLGILGFVCTIASADDIQSYSPSQRAIVIGESAELFVGEDPIGRVAPGRVLRVTQRQEEWLYAPDQEGWIQSEDVIPIEKADAHFTKIIEQSPSPEAYHHRGIARHALGFHELAMEDFDAAIKTGLKSPALFINRANVWHAIDNDRNALADITKAVEADPENALAFNNRGLIYAALGNLGEALNDFTTAIRLDPDYAEAFNNRGVTRVKRGEFEAARHDYSRAVNADDSYAEAYANRGFACKKLGKYLHALADYRRAVELAPESPQAFNDAAWLVSTCPDTSLHNGVRAVEYAEYACELTERKNADFIDTLAAAYARAGRFDEAVKTQKQALTMLSEESRAAASERLKLYQQHEAVIDKP